MVAKFSFALFKKNFFRVPVGKKLVTGSTVANRPEFSGVNYLIDDLDHVDIALPKSTYGKRSEPLYSGKGKQVPNAKPMVVSKGNSSNDEIVQFLKRMKLDTKGDKFNDKGKNSKNKAGEKLSVKSIEKVDNLPRKQTYAKVVKEGPSAESKKMATEIKDLKKDLAKIDKSFTAVKSGKVIAPKPKQEKVVKPKVVKVKDFKKRPNWQEEDKEWEALKAEVGDPKLDKLLMIYAQKVIRKKMTREQAINLASSKATEKVCVDCSATQRGGAFCESCGKKFSS